MRCAVAFVLFACAAAQVITPGPCETSSYATSAVAQMQSILASNIAFQTSPPTLDLASQFYDAVMNAPFSSTFATSVFVAFPRDDSFFSFINCATSATFPLLGCSPNTNPIAYVASPPILGGKDIYYVYSNMSAEDTKFSSNHFASSILTALGAAQSGWVSIVPPFLAGTVANETYVSMYNGIIVGATRLSTEPCNTCVEAVLDSSPDITITQALSSWVARYPNINVTTFADIQNMVASMFMIVTSSASSLNLTTIPTIYFGIGATEASYLIKDCNRWTSACPAGNTARYVAWVVNQNVFGNLIRHLFPLDNTGMMASTPIDSTVGAYTVSQRPWYVDQIGWSGSFGAFESTSAILSYSYPIFIGNSIPAIAAVSWYAAEAPQCTFSDATNACHNASYAPAAAMAAAHVAESLTQYSGETLTSPNAVSVACTQLLDRVLAVNNGFIINVYYANNMGEFVMVKACNTTASATAAGCSPAVNFTCWVRSPLLFGDVYRHVYPFAIVNNNYVLPAFAAGILQSMPAATAVVTAAYVPITRPWYQQLNIPGWSNTTYAFASGGIGESYSFAFNGGVAAADRLTIEPCSACLQQALNAQTGDVALANAVASNMAGSGNAQTWNDISQVVNTLWTLANTSTTPGQAFQYVSAAFASGDSYFLQDCRRWTSSCGGTSATFTVWIRNTAYFKTMYRYLYAIDNNGNLQATQLEASSTPYFTTNRTWYVAGSGWTVPFASFAANLQMVAYATPMAGGSGVGGTFVFLAQAPQCNFSVNTSLCHAASYAVPAATAAATVGAMAGHATTITQVASICAQLYSATTPLNMMFYSRAFFGLSNGDYYQIQYCNISSGYQTPGCNAASYTCWVRNSAVFGDAQRHVFAMSSNGMMLNNGAAAYGSVGVIAGPYSTTTSTWYAQINLPGWSNASVNLPTASVDETYSVPFAGGVAGALRYAAEPCSSCMTQALDNTQGLVALTTATAAMAATLPLAATFAQAAANAKKLWVVAMNNTLPGQMLPDTYFGVAANSDSYLVQDCRRWTTVCTSNTTYVVWFRNQAIFGDGFRRQYDLDNFGNVIGTQNSNVSISPTSYNTVTRAWFTAGAGWSPILISFSSNLPIYCYSVPFPNGAGVAAISYFVAEAPQCTFSPSTNACYAVSYAPGAANAAASLGSLVAAQPAITTIAGVAAACGSLLNATIGYNNGFYRNAYFGLSNNDFYMIKYCKSAGASTTAGCGTNSYTCWVRNTAVFGDTARHVFAMSDSTGAMLQTGPGAFGSLSATSAYLTTMRPWYVQINLPGWSNTSYAFASTGSGASYSVPFAGGVAAADRWDAEPCDTCTMTALMSSRFPLLLNALVPNIAAIRPASYEAALAALDAVVNEFEYGFAPTLVRNYTSAQGFLATAIFNCSLVDCSAFTSYSFVEGVGVAQSTVFEDYNFHAYAIANGAGIPGTTLPALLPQLPVTRGWVPIPSTPMTEGGWYYVETAPTNDYSIALFLNASSLTTFCQSAAVCGPGGMYNLETFSCQSTTCPPGSQADGLGGCVSSCGAGTTFDEVAMVCVPAISYYETKLQNGVCVPDCGPRVRRFNPSSCSSCSSTTTAAPSSTTTTTTTTKSSPASGSSTTTTTTTTKASGSSGSSSAPSSTTTTTTTTKATTTTQTTTTTPAYVTLQSTVLIQGVLLAQFQASQAQFAAAVRSLSPYIVAVNVVSASAAPSSRRSTSGTQVTYTATTLPASASLVSTTLDADATNGALVSALHAQPAFASYTLTTTLVSGAQVAGKGPSSSGSSGLSDGAIAGIVIACILGVVAGALITVLLMRRAQAKVPSDQAQASAILMDEMYDPYEHGDNARESQS